MSTILIPFHAGDQHSAQLVIENILSFDSGMEDALKFRLQFDRPKSECRIGDSIKRLSERYSVEFCEVLPEVTVPAEFRTDDPNGVKIDDLHTVRTPETKDRILAWNRAVYSAIQTIDLFAVIEPDCVILKNGWAKYIFDAASSSLNNFPIFGHLKTGQIGGSMIPTHFAGCSVYDGKALRNIITEKVFQERYPNPWWPLRKITPTAQAGNCYWGPVFSGYDISFDYFLYAHLQRERHGHDRALDWNISDLANRSDLILCDFHSRKTLDEIFVHYFGRQPVIHGIKDDGFRHAIIKRARGGLIYPGYALGGSSLESPYRHDIQALTVQVPTQPAGPVGQHNDRFTSLEGLHNRFAGKRCFIIANGPSLNRTDLSRLKNEYTIGLNRIGLNLSKMGFEPTFLCCVNPNVTGQFPDDFDRASSIKFLSKKSEGVLKNKWNTFFMNSIPKLAHFEADLRSEQWCEGWTVTYCAMQVAYFLGFEEVILVGLDHFFGDTGDANKSVVSQGADQNHFHPAYFGKGTVWQYPDLARSEQHYLVARDFYEANGRRLLDATIGGHCTIFEKIDYDDITQPDRKSASDIKPKISIVIPVWNQELYIESAIKSILAERLDALEIVCVDDHSTDRSAAVIRGLAASHEQIRLVSTSGKGVSDARNTGIAFCRGEFVAFLDADDAVSNGSIRKRAEALEANPDWVMVHGILKFTDAEGNDLGVQMGLQRSFSCADIHGNPASFNTVMVRRSALHDLSFKSGLHNGEDWLAMAHFLMQGHQSHFVDVGGSAAIYRIHKNSTVIKNFSKHESSIRDIIDIIFREAEENSVKLGSGDLTNNALLSKTKCGRMLSELFWAILARDRKLALGLAKNIINDAGFRYIDWDSTPGPLKVAAARAFYVHVNKLPQIEAKTLGEIASVVQDVAAVLGDGIWKPFKHVFEINSDTSRLRRRSREDHAGVDETGVVALLLEQRKGPENILIDVGAHFGTSAQFFHELGWSIHCFEPDPNNRAKLNERFSEARNVIVDPRAVSDKAATGLRFYTSPESTGISGLLAFRDTHVATVTVDATTVADIVEERKIKKIDFLKIDVEGFDLNVLKGVPWDTLAPDVVECEFEDAKTLKLGHDWKHVADYLESNGYTVYVSEWHPIIRYGIPHDWCRVVPYRGCTLGPDAWGNFLAFREDPGYDAVASAFEKLLKKRGPAAAASASASAPVAAPVQLAQTAPVQPAKPAPAPAPAPVAEIKIPPSAQSAPAEVKSDNSNFTPPQSPLSQPWYAPLGDAVRTLAPALFPVLQTARRALWRQAGSPLVWIAALGALGVIGVAAFAPGLLASRLVLAGAALGGIVVLGLGALGWRLRRAIQTLSAENRRLAADIAHIHELAAGREGRVDRLVNDQRDVSGQLVQYAGAQTRSARALEDRLTALDNETGRTVHALRAQISRTGEAARYAAEAALRAEAARLTAEQTRVADALKVEIDRVGKIALSGEAARSGAEASLRAELSGLEARLADTNLANAGALRDELASLQAELDQKLKDRAASTTASFGRAAQAAKRREAELQDQIDALQTMLLKAEGETASTRAAVSEAEAALREELKAVRQGLEQRLRAEVDEAAAEAVARHDRELQAQIGALASRLESQLGGQRADITALRDGLQDQIAELAKRLETASGEVADNLREEMTGLQQAIKAAEETAASARETAIAADGALRDELGAVRQGLEQRLRAEVDEATAESVGRLTALRDGLQDQIAELAKRLETASGEVADNLREEMTGLQQAIKAAEETAASARETATAGDGVLREELETLRKGSAETGTALQNSLKSVTTRLSKTEAHSVSLHITSALRTLRPLWTGGSAVQALKEQAEVEHGHELLMAVLADEEKASPGKLAGRSLIEIGTTRENDPAQSSTQKLGVFSALTGLRFITVDMDPANTSAARNILRYINPGAQALTQKGEVYLRQHPVPLEYVYLDAFDFDHGNHSEQRQASYRKYLGTEISDPACWKMHEDCAETIIARMVEGGVVVLDDTWTDEEGRYAGKGKLAAPLLMENGFTLIARTRKTLALRRSGG